MSGAARNGTTGLKQTARLDPPSRTLKLRLRECLGSCVLRSYDGGMLTFMGDQALYKELHACWGLQGMMPQRSEISSLGGSLSTPQLSDRIVRLKVILCSHATA